MNIQSITERSMITPQGEEVILFLLQPTNVSVLSREGLRARVNALMNVLKGFAEVELLCLNSRESFEHNKQYLARRIEQEPVPQIRALLDQENPLAYIYERWENDHAAIGDLLCDTIYTAGNDAHRERLTKTKQHRKEEAR